MRTWAGLALGGASGMAASAIGIPLPWLIGPLLATIAVSLSGVSVPMPPILRKAGQLVAALAIGTSLSASVVASLVGFIDVMLIAALLSIAAGIATALMVARLARVPFDTAYFASMPGGVAEMSLLAERFGGDTALVALAQSLRVVIVVMSVPIAIVAFNGGADVFSALGAGIDFRPLWLVVMLGGAVGLALVLDRLGVLNAWFLSGLVIGALFTLAPLPVSRVPFQIVDVAQVLIGCSLGSRIKRDVLIKLRKFLPATILGTLAMIVFNIAVSYLASLMTSLDIPTLILATSPGGVAEMSITAKALHLVAPLVTAFHLVRILIIVLFSASIYRLASRALDRIGRSQAAE